MPIDSPTDISMSTQYSGHQDILNDILNAIERKEAAFTIVGPAGSGKSTVLMRTDYHLSRKQFISIYITGKTYAEQVMSLIFQKAEKKGITYPILQPLQKSEWPDLRSQILWLTDNFLKKEKVILIFDDFEENLTHNGKFLNDRLKEFLFYLKDSFIDNDSFMLFASETDIPGFTSGDWNPLTGDELKRFLDNCQSLKSLNQKSRETMLFDIGANLRGLILLDKIAFREFGKKKFTWEMLKGRIPGLGERILYKTNESADFSPLYLEKLMTYVNESDRSILNSIAVFAMPIDKKGLAALMTGSTAGDLKKLLDLGLLNITDRKGFYGMHGRTASFIRSQMNGAEYRHLNRLAASYYEKTISNPGKLDVEFKNIQVRHFLLEAEEWDMAAERSLFIELSLSRSGYPQLAFDLIKEIEHHEFNASNRKHILMRLSMYCMIFSKYDEVIGYSLKLLPYYDETTDMNDLALVYKNLGLAYENKLQWDDSIAAYEKSRNVYIQLKNETAAADIMLKIGTLLQKKGKYEDALIQFYQSRDYFVTAGDAKRTAQTLQHIGRAMEEQNRLDDALDAYRQAQDFHAKSGNERDMADGLHQIGNVLFLKGMLDEATDSYNQSILLNEKLNNLKGIANSLGQLGIITQRRGQREDATHYYQRALEIFQKLDDKKGIASGFHQMGRIYQESGRLDEALENYNQSLQIREETGDVPGMAIGYGQLGMLYCDRGEYESALRASVKSFVIFSRMNAPGAILAKKTMLKIREKLPLETFNTILKEFNINTDPSNSQNSNSPQSKSDN